MIAKKAKTSRVEKNDANNYWKRSQELLESMRNNLIIENLNAAVIDGIHAAISANDALTVAAIGKRSTGDNHMEAVELLKQSVSADHLSSCVVRLRRILYVKSHVEYGSSLVTPKEAKKVAQDVERFIAWAEGVFRNSQS
ncbi:hypothetical protein KKA47_07555 [bacterium]|nr:hypothetical protein [bacterium]